jgi:hypothetical protein
MKLHVVASMACVVVGIVQGSVCAQDVSVLVKRVKIFSERYNEALKNLRCDVDGNVAGNQFKGTIAILNGVLPFRFPPSGAFEFSRFKKGTKSTTEMIKVGNSQYSFRVVKQEVGQTFGLEDLYIQIDNRNRMELLKDPIFFSFSAVDSMAVFAPIMVFDMASIDLLNGSHGGRSQIIAAADSNETVVEFIFPDDHPFKHEWARVSFGKFGEVLDYKIRNRPKPNHLTTYSYVVDYSESETSISGVRLPSELRIEMDSASEGRSIAKQENWVKLGNFQFGKNDPAQFTLTHYGIPEPEGTTVLGRPLPYWLLGTVSGVGFLALGVYLRRRSERSE